MTLESGQLEQLLTQVAPWHCWEVNLTRSEAVRYLLEVYAIPKKLFLEHDRTPGLGPRRLPWTVSKEPVYRKTEIDRWATFFTDSFLAKSGKGQ